MKNIIYQGHKEEYFCFTTSEAANAIQTYFQYRQRYDEKLTPESYLFVQQTNTSYYQQRREDNFNRKYPKRMQLKALSKLLADAGVRSGIVQSNTLLEGQKFGTKHNKIFRTHGYRKFVTGKFIEAGLSDWAIEKLLGHKSKGGVTSKHYYRPQEEELLHEYVEKCVDYLTINAENRLKRAKN